jgi:phospholipid/cholesterol/gamma-HCH transport system substrate-binding protein
MTSMRAVLVGAFVLGGLVLFSIGLFLIGNRRMLFADNFDVRSQFAEVAGLQPGAKVRVAGMDAGEVREINVTTGPRAKFQVVMRVRSDLHQVIRTDSVASIQNDGLVGNKFVQIEAGTDAAPVVAENGTIPGEEPIDLSDIMKKMSDTIDNVNETIDDLQDQLAQAVAAVTDTAQTTQLLVDDVGKNVREIADAGSRITTSLGSIVADVQAGHGTVGKMLKDDTLYAQTKDIATQVQKTVANLREASEQAKSALADFRGGNGPMTGLTGSLNETLNYARDAMADLADNAEALKHNFLFRGYFNRRGYFDIDELTVDRYRAGALESSGRVALRIWLGRDVLLASDVSGREVLTDEGRRRLESAMSQFVRYPRNSPIVVEGYAQEDTSQARYLLSRQRAQLALDYLVAKFGLDQRAATIMPMGSEAVGSPNGSTWEGIALTIFVSKDALAKAQPVAQHLIDER